MGSNPLNFTDPTGYCVEGADDYNECMAWAHKIEEDFKFINVIVCNGDDVAEGCIGWAAEEMKLLFMALSDFNFSIDTAIITIIRTDSDYFAGSTAPEKQNTKNTRYTIRITNSAWYSPPAASFLDAQVFQLFRSADYFLGVIAHELTHVAIFENHAILDRWIELTSDSWLGEPNFFVGSGYSWSYKDSWSDEEKKEELLCMVNSALMYDPIWNLWRHWRVPYIP